MTYKRGDLVWCKVDRNSPFYAQGIKEVAAVYVEKIEGTPFCDITIEGKLACAPLPNLRPRVGRDSVTRGPI